MRWTVWILMAFLLVSGVAHAGSGCPRDALLELENNRKETLATEYLEDSRWGASESVDLEEVFGVELLEPQVQVYDQRTAIVTGTWRVVGLQKGCRVESSRRFTHVWVLVEGEWRLMSRHLALE